MKTSLGRLMLILASLSLLASGALVAANQPRPFVSGSQQQILAAHQGKPFILALWSLSCVHCQEELAMFSALLKKHPGLDIIFVSIDSPEQSEALTAALQRHGLGRAESWVFADNFTERLRYEIDRKWHGELPRTYFYGVDHSVEAASGKLDPARIELWLTR
ncbi:MAG: TlpA disulfide reductase family protein [Pseudomonadota bacterium]